ncbi:MAG: DNA-binding protein [Coriobacteriia bacterium]|nr:DNA-binding protein [Coriobacteriia bacterium]
MGGGVGSEGVTADAERLGELIASRGWVVLTGGRDAGVMAAASRGAKRAGGLVVGVLPGVDLAGTARDIDVPILTGMGDARNVVNVLSSRVVVVLPGEAGTLSEAALALKADRPVVTLGFDLGAAFDPYRRSRRLVETGSPSEALAAVERFLDEDAARWEARR